MQDSVRTAIGMGLAALAVTGAPTAYAYYGPAFPIVTDSRYIKVCSECHMAYQPQLLPERSWRKVLDPAQLKSHFGESLDIEPATRDAILAYLTANSAEHSDNERSKEILRSIPRNETPIAISKTPHIYGWHVSLFAPAWEGYTMPSTPGACNVCHYRADLGDYNERHFGVRDRTFTIRKDPIKWWE